MLTSSETKLVNLKHSSSIRSLPQVDMPTKMPPKTMRTISVGKRMSPYMHAHRLLLKHLQHRPQADRQIVKIEKMSKMA